MTSPYRTGAPPADWQFRYSGVRYKPAAGTTILALTTASGEAIGYMERGHINVWKSSDAWVTSTALVRPGDYDFNDTGTSIVLVVPTAAGQEYVLARETPLEPYVQFADGANLTAEQLNRLARVSLYRDQEQADALLTGGVGGGGGGGAGGTVVRVQGGAGLTGDITVSGALNVGAGAGISALTDSVAVNRAQVDTWYASATHGHAVATTSAAGFMSTADRTKLDALSTTPPTTNLDGLSDVVISGPLLNEVLLYDGTKWKNSIPGGGTAAIPLTINRNYSSFESGMVTSGQIAFNNNRDWQAITTVWINYTDSISNTSNESALRAVVLETTLRVAYQTGTFEFILKAKSFAGTTATYTVTPVSGPGQYPNNGSAVSVTLNGTPSGGVIELNQLNDVTLTSPTNDQVLKYNSTTAQWVNAAAPAGGGGATNLDGLTDVTIATPTSDQILKYNGSQWVNAAAPAGGGGVTNLDGLTDVTITTPSSTQILQFNGSQWVNAAAPVGGGGGTVTQVNGGAGLTGAVTTSGALAVGQGTGITVNADDVAINRTTVDAWYAPRDLSTLPVLP